MTELIAQIVFVGSLFGITVILLRKAPVLASLPAEAVVPEISPFISAGNKIKNFPLWKDFSINSSLQKLLLKFRILALKVENQISHWLEMLREKDKKQKANESAEDNYWEELRRAKNGVSNEELTNRQNSSDSSGPA